VRFDDEKVTFNNISTVKIQSVENSYQTEYSKEEFYKKIKERAFFLRDKKKIKEYGGINMFI